VAGLHSPILCAQIRTSAYPQIYERSDAVEDNLNKQPLEHTINVRVITSSGRYPEHGNEKVSLTEQVQAVLERAAKKLQILDTSQWVANVNGAPIQISMTYAQLGLHGEVKIDWGRSEGGGG
jgi:hypothetical protein